MSVQLFTISPVHAQRENQPARVIEANEFRVIDKFGNHIASLKGGIIWPGTNWQQPVLEMKGKYYQTILTSTELLFRGDDNRSARLSQGSLFIREKNNVISLISTSEGATIRISDNIKNIQDLTDNPRWGAVLGNVKLVTKGAGTVKERSAASLVLFDKDGNVIWSTPE